MDARLRQLERLLRSGDPALLRERLRAGQLSPDDLWLAAHLGHEGARELLGDEAPGRPGEELLDWVVELVKRGLAVNVALAAAEAALPVFEAARPNDDRLASALRALAHPFGDLRHHLADAHRAVEEAGFGPPHWAAVAVLHAAMVALDTALEGRAAVPGSTWVSIDAAVRALGSEQAVRAAIALALLPPALHDLDVPA